ncbi:hypothetical protein F4809DRAFT_642093 [Biscogniauxia mediterranea]|nr:hypothetical protein F4809DRAFT_642093 [Biscogniauxia mediterranea]
MTRVEIEPDGDLRLDVGEGDRMKQFVVCSKAVVRSSRPFRVMLTGGFAESKRSQSSTGEWVVALPDDSPDTAEVFLNIAHARLEEVTKFGYRLTVIELYDLTVFTDKLWVSWEVGDGHMFKYIAKVLALDGTLYDNEDNLKSSTLPLRDENVATPPLIMDKVESVRLETLSTLFALIQDIVDGLESGTKSQCSRDPTDPDYNACAPSMTKNIIRSLVRDKLWPLPKPSECHSSVKYIALKLMDLDMEGGDTFRINHCCTCSGRTRDAINGILRSVSVPLEEAHTKHLQAQSKKTGLNLESKWFGL